MAAHAATDPGVRSWDAGCRRSPLRRRRCVRRSQVVHALALARQRTPARRQCQSAPDRMPFMRAIVEHAGRTCRVFNLSFGLEPCDGFLSVHEAELDQLARELNVLFIVSSGNVIGAADFAEPYPQYLKRPEFRSRVPG